MYLPTLGTNMIGNGEPLQIDPLALLLSHLLHEQYQQMIALLHNNFTHKLHTYVQSYRRGGHETGNVVCNALEIPILTLIGQLEVSGYRPEETEVVVVLIRRAIQSERSDMINNQLDLWEVISVLHSQ